MAKLPFMQWYPADWIKDTRELSLLEKGFWVDVINFMWQAPKRGELKTTLEGLSRLIGCRWNEVEAIMKGLIEKGILECHAESHDVVTLVSRRMKREENARELTALRQSKARVTEKSRSSNAENHGKVTGHIFRSSYVHKQKKTNNNDFETFWKTYPKKIGKGAAEKAWEHAVKEPEGSAAFLEVVVKAVEEQKRSAQWQKEDGQYIPNPATWLNQRRWLDETQQTDTNWQSRALDQIQEKLKARGDKRA